MTLPALISKMSGRVPRFVTVDGQVVAGTSVVSTSNGYRDPEHGRVTPVTRHTNHGGKPPDEHGLPPWWEREPARVEAEIMAMASAFPGFEQVVVGGAPAWRGVLNTGRGRFKITIVHRADHGLPHVLPSRPNLFRRSEAGRVRRSPHLYDNGNLCVAGQDDWDSDRHDATTVTGWAAHWLASFTEWRITGRGWPCSGVDLDAA